MNSPISLQKKVALITNIYSESGKSALHLLEKTGWTILTFSSKTSMMSLKKWESLTISYVNGLGNVSIPFSSCRDLELVLITDQMWQEEGGADQIGQLNKYLMAVVRITHRILHNEKMNNGGTILIAPSHHHMPGSADVAVEAFLFILEKWADQLSEDYQTKGVRVRIQSGYSSQVQFSLIDDLSLVKYVWNARNESK